MDSDFKMNWGSTSQVQKNLSTRNYLYPRTMHSEG